MKKKKILMVSYGGGHVNMLLPIFIQLSNDFEVEYLACTTAINVLKAAGEEPLTFANLVRDHQDNGEIISLGEEVVAKYENGVLDYKESVAYMGVGLYCLIKEFGETKGRDIFQRKGRFAFNPELFLASCIEKKNYDLIITTTSPRTEEAVINIAQRLGIQSICVFDFYSERDIKQRLCKNTYGDYITVINNTVKAELVKYGRDPASIIVTGNPVFDNIESINNIEEIKKSINADQKKIVTWIKSYSEASRAEEERLENIFSSQFDDNFHFLYRCHPSDPRNRHLQNISPDSPYQGGRLTLNELLNISDIVVTIASTVSFQAAILGKKVLQVNINKSFEYIVPFSKLGFGVLVKSDQELIEEINSCSLTQVNDVYKQKSATNNIINLVKDLFQQNKY